MNSEAHLSIGAIGGRSIRLHAEPLEPSRDFVVFANVAKLRLHRLGTASATNSI